MSKIESLIQFLTVDIWRMSHDKRTEKHGMWIAVFKKLYLAVQFFIDKGVCIITLSPRATETKTTRWTFCFHGATNLFPLR